ncbi:protein adenylyltransferase SelO [Inhella proteolytica]|uniref:Protein nucleotidyltransferase YdiU n=1 Tax=Inhella proteolytica TaxID=2795029 RepID=A0A931J6W6_9BURK|nr:YdiU family protein [Inhella proteolytica]MBH9577230.1 YdiU family protein [Inhella proteolytica]
MSLSLPFDNSYARELPGLYVDWPPAAAPAPRLLFLNQALGAELGLPPLAEDQAAALFAGNALPAGAQPIAQAYAGHQFGGFSPSLGDGRALLIGELIDASGQRRDLAFKGSGRTPFSRGGDGKAAVGPMLREVLIGEAMHALGVPTTRALAVVATGESVYREEALPGAVLTRVAASHLRVGTFQYFAARGEFEQLARLADYAIARHDPGLSAHPERLIEFLRAVSARQARLIAQWMNLGFIHGVMNTDNMTISGETIDYGPCAFMEAYDPATKFSSIDQRGRYAYGNQPPIAQWNLARLAEALLPLLADPEGPESAMDAAVAQVTAVLDGFPALYEAALRAGQARKLGSADAALSDDWLALLQQGKADFTASHRALAAALEGDETPLRRRFESTEGLDAWLARWRAACAATPAELRAANPAVIPRNHRVEEALAAASEADDLTLFEALLVALRRPFDEDPARARFTEPAPPAQAACYRTFCGT